MEKNLDEEQHKNTGFEEFNTRYDTVEEEIVRKYLVVCSLNLGCLQKYMREL